VLCAARTPRKLVRREPSSPSSTSPQMAHTTINTYRAEYAPLVVWIISGHRVPGCILPLLSSLLSSYLIFLLPHPTSLLDTRTCRIAWHLYLCFHLWPLVLFVASIRTGSCVLYFPTAHSLHACQQGHHPILPQRAPGRLPAVRVAPTASALFALWMLSPRQLALLWPCLPTQATAYTPHAPASALAPPAPPAPPRLATTVTALDLLLLLLLLYLVSCPQFQILCGTKPYPDLPRHSNFPLSVWCRQTTNPPPPAHTYYPDKVH